MPVLPSLHPAVSARNDAFDERYDESPESEAEEYLTFDDYCQLMAGRQEEEFKLYELAARFRALDANGNGVVEKHEFARWTLIDALSRLRGRILDLVSQWDSNGNGLVSRREFRRAVAACHLDFCSQSDVDAVFDEIDEDRSGELDVKELSARLRPGVLVRQRIAIRKHAGGRVGNRTNSGLVQLVASADGPSVPEQLVNILVTHRARVLDLFREWDEDGDGLVDVCEFRAALSLLGYDAPKPDINALFRLFDSDASGAISFDELHRALRKAAKQLRKPTHANSSSGGPLGAPRGRRPNAQWLPREVGRAGLAPPVLDYRKQMRTGGTQKPLQALRTLPPLQPHYM